MKTINEGIQILRNMYGCRTCGMSKDENGNNMSYNSYEADNLIGHIEDGKIEVVGIREIPNDFDVYLWAQEFDTDNVEALRQTVSDNECYLLTLEDEFGTDEILIWSD